MQEFLSMNYEWLRAIHLIAVMCWMAGLLYLPRLFVYHAEAEAGSEKSEMLKVMERRLYKFITTPAMMVAWIFGLLMIWGRPSMLDGQGWLHVKLLLVFLMSGMHGACGSWLRKFANDENTKSHQFYRYANEVPTILMIVIVILAVVEPF